MRGILLAVIVAVGLALGVTSNGNAAPASGTALIDAVSAVQLAEQVHCRWDGRYHCHSWGCHTGCSVRRRHYYAVPRYRVYRYHSPRYRYHRNWRRW